MWLFVFMINNWNWFVSGNSGSDCLNLSVRQKLWALKFKNHTMRWLSRWTACITIFFSWSCRWPTSAIAAKSESLAVFASDSCCYARCLPLVLGNLNMGCSAIPNRELSESLVRCILRRELRKSCPRWILRRAPAAQCSKSRQRTSAGIAPQVLWAHEWSAYLTPPIAPRKIHLQQEPCPHSILSRLFSIQPLSFSSKTIVL